MNYLSKFPLLQQFKPKPKPAPQVQPIVYELPNGERLIASPNVWLAAIITSLDPKTQQRVIDKVRNIVARTKSGIIPAKDLSGLRS